MNELEIGLAHEVADYLTGRLGQLVSFASIHSDVVTQLDLPRLTRLDEFWLGVRGFAEGVPMVNCKIYHRAIAGGVVDKKYPMHPEREILGILVRRSSRKVDCVLARVLLGMVHMKLIRTTKGNQRLVSGISHGQLETLKLYLTSKDGFIGGRKDKDLRALYGTLRGKVGGDLLPEAAKVFRKT
jgi:hypothetical protein